MPKPRKQTSTTPETISQDTALDRVAQQYTVGVTDHAVGTMKNTDPKQDPIAAQYIPQASELLVSPQERTDPIGDEKHSPVKGIVHRYPDRALYKITNICPVYCRYCFRKSMVGPANESLKKSDRAVAIDYIKNTPSIWEVILTGGDPLILSAKQINEALDEIENIDHVQTLRIHTRTPIAAPDKITSEMAAALTRDKALYIVLHINHVNEITPEVITALKSMQAAGAILLSQSVLLKGVNDDPKILEALFRKLVTLKVKPYMLHHLDPAPGTEHFRISIKDGQDIVSQLRGNVSGICLPEYMLDIPGGYGKVPLTPSHCEHMDNGDITVTDYQGNTHDYKN